MAIVSLTEALDFLDISEGYFEINTVNNTLNLTSNQGGPVDVDMSSGDYSGSEMASELQRAMNANGTLTGGSLSFSVSYSSSTRKFTIDAGAGNTISYDDSESDGGLTLGFTQDASAAQTITSDRAAGDPTAIVVEIKAAIEEYVQKSFCKRTFESTSYSLERYDGRGERVINLDHFPIVSIDRVAVGTRQPIKIRNTSSYSTASISVASTGLRLVKDGTADSTVLFATYGTMTTVVAAVNDLSGWEAARLHSDFANFKATELIDRYAANAIDDNWVELSMPNEGEDGIEVYANRGQIVRSSVFPKGARNVFVDYTAGYSSDDMPEDLKLGIKIAVAYFYQKREEESFGTKSSWTGKVKIEFEKGDLPREAIGLLGHYRRRKM